MKTQSRRAFELALTLAALVFHSIGARSDTVYVWSYDTTIKQFTTNGVGVVVATNISGWNGPVGLTLDVEGNLYSGCPGNSSITKFTANGNASVVGFVDSVSALAFDAGGNLFSTSPNYAAILSLRYMPGYGWTDTNYSTSHLSYPVSLAFDSTGNIYAANSVAPSFPYQPEYTNTIAKFSPNLAFLETFATDLDNPWGLAFDKTGNLYVSNSGGNRIYKFTPGGSVSIFAEDGDLSDPRGLAFDTAGNLYVANHGNGTIGKFTPDGNESVFATNLVSPTSIAIQPGLKLWATTITLMNPTILSNGAFQFTFANTPVGTNVVLTTTNLAMPLTNWTVLGGVSEVSPGQFQFTDPQATNNPQRFYRVRWN